MEDAKDDLGSLTWGQAEQRAAQGDVDYLRKLATRLADRHAAAVEQVRDYEYQLAHVVRVLALTPGQSSLVQLLQLLDEKRPVGSGVQSQFVASLLAEHQRVADLAATVFNRRKRDRLDDLRSCLLHELVLRGVDVEASWPLRFWSLARPGGRPLNWLPAHRSGLETHVRFPSRKLRSSAGGVSTGLPTEGRVDPPTPRTTEPSALRDIATLGVHETIVAAVEAGGWGDCGAWVFTLDEAITIDRVPALLPTLPMSCVEGLGPSDRFEVATRPVEEIWGLLFETASMGGMYSSGAQGAYGRLWAWKSIAGLSGSPMDASMDEVERRARKCTWFHFEADAEWFHNEIYDYGIAALSPDRRRIAVLAATDTD
ncbi:DUF6183 family protein [Streptomyces luteolus]|uniref:DUF6183 family protein n=1 Tax=Streptomyces luteolus TaxID=3043615 RepID=A0ABT6SRS4_9ACTN|nr:DUF6183 family protein [Streptomyces sp. B-S-A12]MDI3417940.1 DUF6183 family protein [Streptomyces sp. B-S-A12]